MGLRSKESFVVLGQRYLERLAAVGGVVGLVTVRSGRDSVWAEVTVLAENRPQVKERLQVLGVRMAVPYLRRCPPACLRSVGLR